MTMQEWIVAYSEALHVATPTEQEIAQLLDLAGVAAHASERTAAPLSCWLAAKAGSSPEIALAMAQRLANDNI